MDIQILNTGLKWHLMYKNHDLGSWWTKKEAIQEKVKLEKDLKSFNKVFGTI